MFNKNKIKKNIFQTFLLSYYDLFLSNFLTLLYVAAIL